MASRRGHGEGSIFQRADGLWAAVIDIGYTAEGRRRRRTIYGATKRIVQEKLRELHNHKAAGTLTDAGRMTVGEWLRHWLDTIAKPKLRPLTYRSYESIIRGRLIPHIGHLQLVKLSPVHVQSMQTELSGLAPASRVKTHAVLRKSLSVALRQGLVTRNVCDAVEQPRGRRVEMKTLTADQADELIAAAEGTEYGALIILAIGTGLRQGELFGLQWGDMDAEKGTLTVQRSLIELPAGHEFGPPKSRKGLRTVSLPAMAIEALAEHRAKMLAKGWAAKDHLTFCDTAGGPIRKSNFMRRYFHPLLKAAGVPTVRFHDLRHTSATLMLADGVHPKIVQERLGHSQISLTLDTYSHVLPEMDQAAAGTFDRVLKPRQKRNA
ncbi:MAG: site-specific integrase [Planctomycetaceae bacterium]|nr:site-specific integrase [Planctomycetaceae bacterium]